MSLFVRHCVSLFLEYTDNVIARKMDERCGFEVADVIRKDYKTAKGEVVDLVYYGHIKP